MWGKQGKPGRQSPRPGPPRAPAEQYKRGAGAAVQRFEGHAQVWVVDLLAGTASSNCFVYRHAPAALTPGTRAPTTRAWHPVPPTYLGHGAAHGLEEHLPNGGHAGVLLQLPQPAQHLFCPPLSHHTPAAGHYLMFNQLKERRGNRVRTVARQRGAAPAASSVPPSQHPRGKARTKGKCPCSCSAAAWQPLT